METIKFIPLEKQTDPVWIDAEHVTLQMNTGDTQEFLVKQIRSGSNEIVVAAGEEGRGVEYTIAVPESFLAKRPPQEI